MTYPGQNLREVGLVVHVEDVADTQWQVLFAGAVEVGAVAVFVLQHAQAWGTFIVSI